MLQKLFMIFFKLGFVAFGGGYSIIPLVEREVIDKHHIIEKKKFADIISVAEGLPGAIALNVSIFIGYTTSGILGALAAALGSLIPSLLIITTIMFAFSNISTLPVVQSAMAGIRPVVIALIAFAAFKIGKVAYKSKGYFILTIIGMLLALFAHSIPLPFIIIGGLVVGMIINLIGVQIQKGRNK